MKWVRCSSTALALWLALTCCALAQAGNYPERVVRLIVPFAAGGGIDVLARLVAQQLSVLYGKPVVVENHVGATGLNAVNLVGMGPNDGYTLLVGSPSPFSVLPALRDNLPFNNLQDFVPVTLFGVAPEALTVNPKIPATTIPALIAHLKNNPGKLTFGNTGPGGLPHLSVELFAQLSGAQVLHVPYRGTGPALVDLISGHIDGMIDSLITQLPMIQQGQVRALGVTLKQRSPALPDIPTISEFLPDYEAISWVGLFAPPATSRELVAKLQGDVRQVLQQAEVRDRMAAIATVPDGRSSTEFTAFIKADVDRWRRVAAAGHIKAE